MMRTALGAVRTFLAVLFLIVLVPPAALIAFPWTIITGNVSFLYRIGMALALAAPETHPVTAQVVR